MWNEQCEMAARLAGYSNGYRYRTRGEFLFKGISLAGAYVLEVGCGSGAWAIWAALQGAERVVGIEPDAYGSSRNSLERFRQAVAIVGLSDKVVATSQFLHEVKIQGRGFDVVVMYNVINHLDEYSVAAMHRDKAAFERYVGMLRKLCTIMSSSGLVVVADCARLNFWPSLSLASPWARNIEWHKHQDPDVWTEAFEQAGFENLDLRWSPLQPFSKVTANWFVQFLTCSHFVLRLRVKGRAASA